MNLIDIVSIIIAIIVIGVIVIGGIYVKYLEKKSWNNGICPCCGKPWIHFDTDSQGGRMYRCENWHGCTITYNVDKQKHI